MNRGDEMDAYGRLPKKGNNIVQPRMFRVWKRRLCL